MKKFIKPSKLNNHLICLDYESGSANPYNCIPLELSAIVFDINTLQEKDNGRFSSLLKPNDDEWDLVQDEALKVNHLTREELKKAPSQEVVFKEFTNFCKQFQRDDKNAWSALIPCGHNIKGFYLIISDRLCKKYSYVDVKGFQKLHHPLHSFDLMDFLRIFFHNSDNLPAYNLDSVAEYFGIKRTSSHRAMVDVEVTWQLIKRFLILFRGLSPKYINQFKNAFL